MQIEIFPQQGMSLLVLSDSPVGSKLAYHLWKFGIDTAFVGPLRMSAVRQQRQLLCQTPTRCHRLSSLLHQGRWQWIHLSLSNRPVSRLEPIANIVQASRRLGLYISLTLRLSENARLQQPLELEQGVRQLLPFVTWTTLNEVDALALYQSTQVGILEARLREDGFQGVGVVVSRDATNGLTLPPGPSKHISEEQWLRKKLSATP